VAVETWVVGEEFDASLQRALGAALRELGYVLDDESWGVGGSQELLRWILDAPLGQLVVEAETYVGLSVSGPAAAVDAVRRQMAVVRASI
jgi:hypothetical protein